MIDLELAEAVELGYTDPNWYCGNVQARILRRRGVTTVAVAGSNDLTDWKQDVSAKLVHRDGRGRIFDGFADMADPTHKPFLDYISKFEGPLEFGAHSAGCAVALQWAGWLAEMGVIVGRVQLLAAPTAGDQGFADYYRKFRIPTKRVAMLHDPVPSLPGESRGGAYECDTLVLDIDGNVHEKQDVVSPLRVVEFALAIKNHHPMRNYLRAIRCYLGAG